MQSRLGFLGKCRLVHRQILKAKIVLTMALNPGMGDIILIFTLSEKLIAKIIRHCENWHAIC